MTLSDYLRNSPTLTGIYLLCLRFRRHFGSWGAGNDAGGQVVIDGG